MTTHQVSSPKKKKGDTEGRENKADNPEEAAISYAAEKSDTVKALQTRSNKKILEDQGEKRSGGKKKIGGIGRKKKPIPTRTNEGGEARDFSDALCNRSWMTPTTREGQERGG